MGQFICKKCSSDKVTIQQVRIDANGNLVADENNYVEAAVDIIGFFRRGPVGFAARKALSKLIDEEKPKMNSNILVAICQECGHVWKL